MFLHRRLRHTLSFFFIKFKKNFSGVIALFVALEKNEKNESVFDRLKDLFREPLVEKEKAEVPNALPFYKIKAKTYRGECPWEKIEEAAGALRSRMILPAGISLPKESGLSVFTPTVFFERLLFNTAVDAVEKMGLDPCRVSITVFDENAYLVDLIEKLLPLAFQLRIITSCTAAYEQLAEYLFERYGLSVIVSANGNESVLSSTVIISGSSKPVPLLFSGILFTNEKKKFMNAVVMTGEDFDLPKKYAVLLPDGIDSLLFAGALYELCGADELGKMKYKQTIEV